MTSAPRAADDTQALSGLRVIDRTAGVAGAYCTKILADAGAEVVKVEPLGGDPLRRWGSGALFEFLNTSKKSIHGEDRDLVKSADLLVADVPVDVLAYQSFNPALVVTTITPFGVDGPWLGRPSTEFTLQAACGAIGHRGVPEEPPLAAGGRLGEWIAGTYAALGSLAAYREAVRCGRGEHVDVAVLDCMAVTMTTYSSVAASFAGWPAQPGTGRMVEVPSIEPTKNGFIVFTTNSAQQFADFLVMIERPDLLQDPDLARVLVRFARRHEFESAVRAHTTRYTTEELLEQAALFRIPAAPVLNGATVPAFEQFVARGVFEPTPNGRFLQPRVPFHISGVAPTPFTAAPETGTDTGTISWPERATSASRPPTDPATWRLPLADLRILDCTAWWAGPAATNVLRCLGADVIKVESRARPDAMRFTSTKPPDHDRWWEWSAIFHGANPGKRSVTLDLTHELGRTTFEQLAARADIVVENFTPRVMEQFGLTWERLHSLNPELIMVRMPAFGLDGPWRDRTGFAQTMESLTGMAWLTGSPSGPPVLVRGAGDPLAGMHAVVATLLAVLVRDRDGGGRLVEATMVEAALNAAAEQVIEYGSTGTVLARQGNRGPTAAPQGVYPCREPDTWIALAVEQDAQWEGLASLLGRPDLIADPALAQSVVRRRRHDELDAAIEAWTSGQSAEEAEVTLIGAGVPANVVVAARDMFHNPQLRHRGLFETERHPVTGDHDLPLLPFRFSRVAAWMPGPSPTLGQHNLEVLREAGITEQSVVALQEAGILGDRPA
jgi:crotonobetainyl-CoA:carnitine CoA-transferase CaiB-like acyl-CoA transferase